MTLQERKVKKEAELGILFASRKRLEQQRNACDQQIQAHEIDLIRVDGELQLLSELLSEPKAE